jgi:hypothetical protein
MLTFLEEQKLELLGVISDLFLATTEKRWETNNLPKNDIRVIQLEKDYSDYKSLLEHLSTITEGILKNQEALCNFSLDSFSEEEKRLWNQMFSNKTLPNLLLEQLQAAQKRVQKSLQERLAVPLLTLQKELTPLPLRLENKTFWNQQLHSLRPLLSQAWKTSWKPYQEQWELLRTNTQNKYYQLFRLSQEWGQQLTTKWGAILQQEFSQTLSQAAPISSLGASDQGVIQYRSAERDIQIIEKMLTLIMELPFMSTPLPFVNGSSKISRSPFITILEEVKTLQDLQSLA